MITRFLFAFCLISRSIFSEELNVEPSDQTVLKEVNYVSPPVANLELIAARSSNNQVQTSVGIQGIFLTGNREGIIPEGRPKMTGIQTLDIDIPGGDNALAEILQPYLGKDVTQDTVIEIKQKIMTYYVSQGISTVSVEVPAQKTKGGVVQFFVLRQYFGKPVYKGQIWYNDEQLSRYLGVTPGADIAENNLQNNLSWLNNNPFHYSSIKYIPGDSPEIVDIEVTSQSRIPFRFYERADNTGSESTGYCRFSSGATWGNAMWIGDLLSFEYQFSNQFKRLQSYTLNYTSFLPWKHILTIFGSYATVKPTPVAPAIDIRAKAAQIRPRYTIPFKPFYTPFQQSLIFGFDLKNSNSSIINLSGSSVVVQPTLLPAEKTNINVFQLVGDYNFYNKVGNHSFSVDMSFYASPAQFLPNQSNENYNSLTKNSKVKYCYLNATIGDVITIPKIMAISVLMRGQVSSDTLPGTELFSLGGYDTIRGYHESESAVDNGFIGNLEFRTRPFSFFRKLKDQLLFLAFLDFGVGNNWFVQKKTEAGAKQIPHTQYLLGVGPGLRYTINPHIQIRCDYGFKLHHLLISDPSQQPLLGGFGQFHLGVLASY